MKRLNCHDLLKVIIEQQKNIEHLHNAVLWIHEPAKVRLGHLEKIKTKKLDSLIDELYKP